MALKPAQITVKELADLCLQHMVQNAEQLAEFMVQSGIDPQSLRGLIGTDAFAHGLIDYVVSNEPLLREAMAKLAGVDLAALIRQAAVQIDDAIWRQIAAEEAAIRADPAATHDPDLIELFGRR